MYPRRAIKQGRSRFDQMRADGVQHWILCNVSTSAAVARYAQAVNTLQHRATVHNAYLISNESDGILMPPRLFPINNTSGANYRTLTTRNILIYEMLFVFSIVIHFSLQRSLFIHRWCMSLREWSARIYRYCAHGNQDSWKEVPQLNSKLSHV